MMNECRNTAPNDAADGAARHIGIVIRMYYGDAWRLAHRVELEANWNRVNAGEPLERIAPLD